jgi:hypothetical protein
MVFGLEIILDAPNGYSGSFSGIMFGDCVCAKRIIGSEIILDAPNVGDEAQVDAHFGPFVNSANLDVRLVHGFRRKCDRHGNHFLRTQ